MEIEELKEQARVHDGEGEGEGEEGDEEEREDGGGEVL